jgi:hypothetical protein
MVSAISVPEGMRSQLCVSITDAASATIPPHVGVLGSAVRPR